MSTHESVASVLATAEKVLGFAEAGFQDYLKRADSAESGLHNAITQGRSVTFILQNLSSKVDGWEEWYGPRQQALRDDPSAKWLVELRNRIEKQGQAGKYNNSISIDFLHSAQLAGFARNAPEGTTETFVGDPLGRSGWKVTLPDGSETVLYFSVPSHFWRTSISVDGSPEGFTLDEDLPRWFDQLRQLIAEARAEYGAN